MGSFRITLWTTLVIWKVKFSLYRPGQALRAAGIRGFQKWQGCHPFALAAFTLQEISLLLISVRG
jgi:hypothetical protein